MGKRNLYLNNTPVEEAKALYQKALGELLRPKAEWIPVTESLHRITKETLEYTWSFALRSCGTPLPAFLAL